MFYFRALLFINALWSPAGKGLTSWLSFVMSNCKVVILGQVWCLIISIPDFCLLSHFDKSFCYVTGRIILSPDWHNWSSQISMFTLKLLTLL